jgi:hypothetical protein
MADDDSGRLDQLFVRPGSEESLGPASPLRGQITLLLGERRYEEALELLYAARWRAPDAAEISRGINLLKERLVRRYVEQLGNLDAVPSVAADVDPASLSIGEEERALLHLIYGISSLTDIAHQSRLGRFETYRALSRLVGEGIVVVASPPPGALTSLPAPRRAMPTASAALVPAPRRPPRRWRRPLVGMATLAITVATGAVWWAIDRLGASSHPAAAIASVPADRTPAGHTVAAPPPASAGSTHEERPQPQEVSAPAAAAPVPSSALRRSSRTAGKSGGRSRGRPPRAVALASEVPAPQRPPASGGVAAAAESEAPSLPDLPPQAAPAALDVRGTVIQASSSAAEDHARLTPTGPVHARRDAPSGLTKAAATSSSPASISVVTSDVSVRGPLGRSVVDQAIARVKGDFQDCYRTAAAAIHRDAGGTARVSLTIDETGYAGAVSVKGGPLPGLDGCLQEAARRIRTRVPPDVGLATVGFGVVFSIGGPAR